MSHAHHHEPPEITNVNKAFIIGIILNLLFVIIEFGTGIITNSLALISDAGHNLSDVGSLLLSLLAFKLANVKASKKFTYGYKKSTVLATLVNSVILLIAVGVIVWESIQRFSNPNEIQGFTVAIVAFVGIIINSFTAHLFFKDKDKDLNIKGAYLHLFADALVSLGVVIGGIIMYFYQLYWVDPILSIIIAIVILGSTINILKDSLRLSLDGVPESIDYENINSAILDTYGVKDLHHIHIWAISTTQNALTAHLIIEENLTNEEVGALKNEIKHKLEHLNIQHATLETEFTDQNCDNLDC